MSEQSAPRARAGETGAPETASHPTGTLTAQAEVRRYKQKSYQLLHASPGMRILDVGCGAGADVRALAELVAPDGSVLGVDHRRELIERAREQSEDSSLPVAFRVEDAARLSFEANSFDGSRADHTFMHLPDRQKVLVELVRVTRPGGWIVITDPDWDTLVVDAPDKQLTRTILNGLSDHVPNPWSGRELYRLCQWTGLREVVVADTVTLVATDFATADRLFRLVEKVTQLEAAGTITAAEGQRWLGSLNGNDQAGYFFCALTAFTVVGRSP